MNFSDLGLSDGLVDAVTAAGYETPTPIQEKAIPIVLMGRDVLGCAQTGTGKTASFTLPMIDILAAGRAKARMPRSLIIAPTRELAAQVASNFETYGKNHKLTMALLIGGVSFDEQEQKLDRGVDVLIATPGRLLDHFERGRVLLSDVKLLVIDEADRMLDMGFIPDVERIVGLLPRLRQTLFFSATMAPEIRRIGEKFLMNPKEVAVSAPATTADTVFQGLVTVGPRDKRAALRGLLDSEDVKNALIFCNRKRDIGVLQRSLVRHGYNAVSLHGDMSQPARLETLEKFKNDEADLMVASDVAARGLDIKGLSHVFNFDVPSNPEDYVHRIGRTGRAGSEGRAFTLATPEDARYLANIVKLIGGEIPPFQLAGVDSAADPAPAPKTRGRRAKSEGEKSPETSLETKPESGKTSGKRSRGSERKRGAERGRNGERTPAPLPDDGGTVIGFGSEMPAFMRNPVNVSNK
ncbi:MAG: DEAD/DEAH box helicase [Alphaproteobacteria bacterium]|nr:DEAD/DEAH box helicase [Alphaproteobacteria bacterium]